MSSLTTDKWEGHFWRGVFSESDGAPSFARVASGIVLLVGIGWVTTAFLKNHFTLPDLTSLALLVGTPYGLNRVTGMVDKD